LEIQSSNVSGVDLYYIKMRLEKYWYWDVVLPANWFKVDKNKNKDNNSVKRLEWGWWANKTRHFCEMIYADELKLYHREMTEYEKIYGKQALA
jgi:hypothetical protein